MSRSGPILVRMTENNQPNPAERRRSPRRRNRNATSLFGDVFDLSVGGMQVFRKGLKLLAVGDELDVELQCEHLAVTLTARIVRRECVGTQRHVYGVEFVGLNKDLRTKLERLSDLACDPCAYPSCWIAA